MIFFFKGKNIRYKDLCTIMINQLHSKSIRNLDEVVNGALHGLVLYRLPDVKYRAEVSSLRLSNDHKPRSPTLRVVDSSILVSRAFDSSKFSLSTLYCAWFEEFPSLVIFWERSPAGGITDQICKDRFIGATTRLSDSFNNLSIAPLTDMKSITENTEAESNKKHIEQLCARRRRNIEEFLANSAECTATFIGEDDDDETIDTMSTLRDIFFGVCPLGDAMITARRNLWQNLNKVILNELKSKWEEAIALVKDREVDNYLVDSEWMEAMWLYVIGCPSEVRSKISFLSLIHKAFSQLKSFEEKEIFSILKWEGFRPSLAQWICDHCSLEDFEDSVFKLATRTSWNSYLFSQGGYVHLHYGSSEFQSVKPDPVTFSVTSVPGIQRDDIRSLPLDMGSNSWAPVDFAKATFNNLKSLMNTPTYYILGHCCPEQSIVKMSKKGMSTLATYLSDKTCGHGMYFFELHWDVFQFSFEDLNNMALQDQPDADLDPRGLQFRAFVYALSRVFQNQNCDALSPSVLVLLLPEEPADSIPEPFDAVNKRLPMCNDNMTDTTSWTCTCPPVFSYDLAVSINPIIDSEKPMSASAIRNAISLINDDDIEKLNAFALLGGIVDFNKIPHGAYKSIISDKSPQKILIALANMDKWDTSGKFKIWLNLLQEPSGSFRRPKTLFNHQGGFSHLQPDNFIRPGMEHWNVCPADPIRETVFVQNSALANLLDKAAAIYVVFLDPGNQWTPRPSSECHLKETEATAYTQANAMAAVKTRSANDPRHLYWKNRSSCRCKEKDIVL